MIPVSHKVLRDELNHEKGRIKLGDELTTRKLHVMRARYDFSVQGGAVSTINLDDVADGKDAKIPSGAIIKQVLIDVLTTLTSGGSATIALDSQGAGDLKAALAVASWTQGLIAGIPVGSAATMIKLTAERTLTATIATAALTAGKFDVIVEYYLTD